MILTALTIAVIAVIALAIFIMNRPDDFRVARSALIDASPPAIYPYISDLRKGSEWSPWTAMDPSMSQSYEGPPDHVGGVYTWSGNNKVGAGAITIAELQENEFVRLRLDFLKPFQATNTAEYKLESQGGQTLMTWSMYGKNKLINKAMSLFMNCDKMAGDMFDKGLNTLKTIVENSMQANVGPSAGNDVDFVITRTFNAPRDKVWNAWTDESALAQWWGPKGFDFIKGSLDLRPGGLFHYGLKGPDGKAMWGKFVFTEVEAPSRLCYIISFSDEQAGVTRHPFAPEWPLEVQTVMTFDELDGKTVLTMRGSPVNASEHERAIYRAGHKSMEQGFAGTLAGLDAFLAKS